ncbi:MAG: diguanylate cyclase [Agarilytica sp.]
MTHNTTTNSANNSQPLLEQLLGRPDVWRGHSNTFIKNNTTNVIDSGYPKLNHALQHKGWPSACLIDVCQHYHAGEWWLFHPAINHIIQASKGGHIALINPPALPFIRGLQQLNIDTHKIIVVRTQNAQEFITSFVELSQSPASPIVFAWPQQYAMSYTQLRKLQLSSQKHQGLYVLFRPYHAKEQSSPAGLRFVLRPNEYDLQIQIFKQKGKLRESIISLAIPESWAPLLPHPYLNNQTTIASPLSATHKTQNIAEASNDLALSPKITSRPLKKIIKHDFR